MKKQLSDEQIDSLMKAIMADADRDDAFVNDISDSPTLWWSVQRKINKQKDTVVAPWPPVAMLRRWLMISVPAMAALALVAGIIIFRGVTATENAGVQPQIAPTATTTAAAVPVAPSTDNSIVAAAATPKAPRSQSVKAAVKTTERRQAKAVMTTAVEKTEIKTDFIALSYARNPESGQLVRVKVPSSMMVTLGLVASVEKPNNLVDAEVVVGDDGLTRAIRFIR